MQEAAGHHWHSRKDVLDPATLFSGVLEMGGASMQLAFLPSRTTHHAAAAAPPAGAADGGGAGPGAAASLRLPGVPQHPQLYSHSYLGMGMDAALARMLDLVDLEHAQQQQQASKVGGARPVINPCLPRGYVSEDGRRHGNASFARCHEVVAAVVPQRKCSSSASSAAAHPAHGHAQRPDHAHGHSHAVLAHDGGRRGTFGSSDGGDAAHPTGGPSSTAQAPHCTVDGTYVPPLSGAFIAMENFAWTGRAVGLQQRATLRELRDVGERHCSRHWSSLQAEHGATTPEMYLSRFCFGAAYIYRLLQDTFGLGLEQQLTWSNTVRDVHGADVGLNWVVGAVVAQVMSQQQQQGGDGGRQRGAGASFLARLEGGGGLGLGALAVLPAATLLVIGALVAALRLQRRRAGAGAGSGVASAVAPATAQPPGPSPLQVRWADERPSRPCSPKAARGSSNVGSSLGPTSRSGSFTSLFVLPAGLDWQQGRPLAGDASRPRGAARLGGGPAGGPAGGQTG